MRGGGRRKTATSPSGSSAYVLAQEPRVNPQRWHSTSDCRPRDLVGISVVVLLRGDGFKQADQSLLLQASGDLLSGRR